MRSLLYVHPSARATNIRADAVPDIVVVDLEEAVREPSKERARGKLAESVAAYTALGLQTVVRVNGADTHHFAEDIKAVAALDRAVGLLLPKPLDEAVVAKVAMQDPGRPLWLMAESRDTPSWLPDVLATQEIAGLVIGGKDLSLDLGLIDYAPQDALLRDVVAEIAAIAMPFRLDVFDAVVLHNDAVQMAVLCAATSGCTGISFIDPFHISALNHDRSK